MNAVTLPAHFDGQQILLDEPYKLEPNTRLAVIILPEAARMKNVKTGLRLWAAHRRQGRTSEPRNAYLAMIRSSGI